MFLLNNHVFFSHVCRLRDAFEARPGASTPQVVMYNMYKEQHSLCSADLQAVEFFRIATSFFPGASLEQDGDTFLVRGIAAKVKGRVSYLSIIT